jgi:hypothetical protein
MLRPDLLRNITQYVLRDNLGTNDQLEEDRQRASGPTYWTDIRERSSGYWTDGLYRSLQNDLLYKSTIYTLIK